MAAALSVWEVLPYILVFLFSLSVFRLFRLLNSIGKCELPNNKNGPLKTMIIFGSGGHTSEMLRLLSGVSANYEPRIYVMADTDKMSQEKIIKLETMKKSELGNQYMLKRIPRSREVHQSWVTTVLTTVNATFHAFPMVFKALPDLVLCNGPGTCIPLCAAALTLTFLGVKKVHVVYVESICRVDSLSLSGKILYYFADKLFVQWPELLKAYPKSIYVGRIV